MRMKRYATFGQYLAAQKTPNRAIIGALRGLMRRSAPGLEETVKWGNGIWVAGKRPVSFVYCREAYVEFGFFNATALDDPQGLLEGKGRFVRHIKMHAPDDVKRSGVKRLLLQAVRVANGSRTGGRTAS